MSLSTAFQTLRLQARSVSSNQLSRSISTPAAPVRPHAPHRHVGQGVAGPSRCFCSSHGRNKASELPLDEIHYGATLDHYRHDQLPSAAADYWQPTESVRASIRTHDTSLRAKGHANTDRQPRFVPPISSPPPHCVTQDTSQSTVLALTHNHFFTPASRIPRGDAAAVQSAQTNTPTHTHTLVPSTYIDTLSEEELRALEDRVRLLTRSGEYSLPALVGESSKLSAQDREQLCSYIMKLCIRDGMDARRIWELYRTWTISDTPTHRMRGITRQLQGGAVFLCCTYLQAAGMTRQAAIVVADARLKPSQARHLLERLLYEFRFSPQPGAQHAGPSAFANTTTEARLAVRQMCDAMIDLMNEGVAFKRRAVTRVFKLLCLSRGRCRIPRLVRAAQRRAQIDLAAEQASRDGSCGGLRTAGGFSRLRAPVHVPPQVVSTKIVEEGLQVLCDQGFVGAQTAYEVLCALDPKQRTAEMYDTLMGVYGNAPPDPVVVQDTATVPGGRDTATGVGRLAASNAAIDAELWNDINTLEHLGGPTLRTMSARIVCHARTRRLELIKADLRFLQTRELGTLRDLSQAARLAILRCHIERGYLLPGFEHARLLLAAQPDEAMQTRIIDTLLYASKRMCILAPSRVGLPSRAQLLKRFFTHFSHLHRRFPAIQPSLESLALFVQLLDSHFHWISTATLWNMLRITTAHFEGHQQRSAPVLEAFAAVFQNRGDAATAEQLRALAHKFSHKR